MLTSQFYTIFHLTFSFDFGWWRIIVIHNGNCLAKNIDHMTERIYEPQHNKDKINKMTYAPMWVQPNYLPSTQISLDIHPVWWSFAVRFMCSLRPQVSSCVRRWLWSDRADVQADLNLRWVHMSFFVMLRLKYILQDLSSLYPYNVWVTGIQSSAVMVIAIS